MFSYLSPEQRLPADQTPSRLIRRMVDTVLQRHFVGPPGLVRALLRVSGSFPPSLD